MKKLIIGILIICSSCNRHFDNINEYKGCIVLSSENWSSTSISGVSKSLRKPDGTIVEKEFSVLYRSIYLKGDTIK